MGLVKVEFKKLCGSSGEFSECGKLIEGIITNGIEINQEFFYLKKPKEIILHCNLARRLEDEAKKDSQLKIWDHEIPETHIKKGREQPDLWLSKNGQPCLFELKVDKKLSNLFLGYSERSPENNENKSKKTELSIAIAEIVNNHKFLENLKKSGLLEKRVNRRQSITGCIYDLFKWDEEAYNFSKRELCVISLAFLMLKIRDSNKNKYKHLSECKDCSEECKTFSNFLKNIFDELKKYNNKYNNTKFNFVNLKADIKSKIYRYHFNENKLSRYIILFMTEITLSKGGSV